MNDTRTKALETKSGISNFVIGILAGALLASMLDKKGKVPKVVEPFVKLDFKSWLKEL